MLEEVLDAGFSGGGLAALLDLLEEFQRAIEILVELEDRSDVATSVAVVRSGPN